MRVKCLAQEHKTVPRLRLDPWWLDPESGALTTRPPRLSHVAPLTKVKTALPLVGTVSPSAVYYSVTKKGSLLDSVKLFIKLIVALYIDSSDSNFHLYLFRAEFKLWKISRTLSMLIRVIVSNFSCKKYRNTFIKTCINSWYIRIG